jgi:hypothetical protein
MRLKNVEKKKIVIPTIKEVVIAPIIEEAVTKKKTKKSKRENK